MNEKSLAQEIRAFAIQCGFDDCGIVQPEAMAGFAERLEQRMRDVPESREFYKHVRFENVRQRFPWARAIVILSYYFGKFRYPRELQGKYAKAYFLYPQRGRNVGIDIARFENWLGARGIRAEGGEHLGFVSVGPLRYLAVKAGLGIFRKNNFFYTANGSWNTLLGYVIDQDCELIRNVDVRPCPPRCDLCQRACGTGALMAPYTMNPLKCV